MGNLTTQDLLTAVGSSKLTVTGPDAGQCTAVAHKWEQMTGNPIVYGDAAQTYANAPAVNYERVAYMPGMIAPAGAVVVFAANNPSLGTGPAGHTSVALPGADAATFVSLDQNWPTGAAPRQVRHNYIGVVGWFIPRNLGGNMSGSQDKVDETAIRLAYNIGLFRDATPAEVANRLASGQTVERLMRDVMESTEHKALIAKVNAPAPVDNRVATLKAALLEVLK